MEDATGVSVTMFVRIAGSATPPVEVQPEVTMTFAGCEASPISKTGEVGVLYNLPGAADCKRTHYTLLGWAHAADHNQTNVNGAGTGANYAVNGTMNAVWKLNNDKVQVTYDANVASDDACLPGGAQGRTKTGLVQPLPVTLDGSAPCTPPGLRLVGWNTRGDGTGTSYAIFGSVPQGLAGGQKITLFAQWGNLCPTVGRSFAQGGRPVSPVPSSNVQWQGCDLRQADLKGADLKGANLFGADLSSADLSEAILFGADLTGANLTNVNLSRALITNANLTNVDLTGVNLTGVNLVGVNLTKVNLSNVNLGGKTLRNSNLTGANLFGANLSSANLSGASLTDANLAGAILTGATLTVANLEGIVSVRIIGSPLNLPTNWKLENGTLVKPPCAQGGGLGDSCKIGDIGPGGGKVFYVSEMNVTGQRYMEVAARLPKVSWAIDLNVNGVNCLNLVIPGSFRSAIGTGQGNTSAITRVCTREQAPAAWAAKNYTSNGLQDWFLPSADELFQTNASIKGGDDRQDSQNGRWSSSSFKENPTFVLRLFFTAFDPSVSPSVGQRITDQWVTPVRNF